MAAFDVDLNNSMGCLFIGVALSLATVRTRYGLSSVLTLGYSDRFYGIACAQVMYYFWNYRYDTLTLRSWVHRLDFMEVFGELIVWYRCALHGPHSVMMFLA